jgi:hypothetical protein
MLWKEFDVVADSIKQPCRDVVLVDLDEFLGLDVMTILPRCKSE